MTDVVGGRVLNIILFTYFIAVKHTWPGLGYSCRLLGLDKYVHHHPTPRGKIEIKINWKIKIHNLTIQPNSTWLSVLVQQDVLAEWRWKPNNISYICYFGPCLVL